MALTRRTPRFAQLADETERLLLAAGFDVTSADVDEILREQVQAVGTVLGVTARTALLYAPDTVPTTLLAAAHATAMPRPNEQTASRGGSRQRANHLRLVRS